MPQNTFIFHDQIEYNAAPDIQSRSCFHGLGEGETGVPAGIAGGDVDEAAADPRPDTLQYA